MNKTNKTIFVFFIITAVVSLLVLCYNNIYKAAPVYKGYTIFQKDLSTGSISKVYIAGSTKLTVELKDSSKYVTDNPRSSTLTETLLSKGIVVSEKNPISFSNALAILVLIISVTMLFISKNTKFASKSLYSVDALDTKEILDYSYGFKDVAGNEEAKDSLNDIVDFLKSPEKYKKYGARMPKGIILYGDPGTGKTLLAKAIAGEAKVPFYALSGSDFVQVYVGVGASRIRQLFKRAKAKGKAVIFIDEIDAIGKIRSNSKGGSSEEKDQTLNALLTEMSGFNENEGIIVLAATNRLDTLDPALLRPGRFDRQIEISLPDILAREKILKLHLENKPYDNLDIKNWANKTAYFSGAKLENLVNEAAILACKNQSESILDFHMEKAYSIIVAGYEKIHRDYIKEEDKKITAYHESGHAIISSVLLPNETLSKITIIPSTNGSGGYTLSIPEDKLYQNKSYLNNRIMVLLAGRAAEEIIFGENCITTGAYSDIKVSTNIITSMITEYGMGNSIGLLSYKELSSLNLSSNPEILRECKENIESLYVQTKEILMKNLALLNLLSENLIEKETLYHKDIMSILKNN